MKTQQGRACVTNPAPTIMFNIDKISGGIFVGIYAALVVTGAFCLYIGTGILTSPNKPILIDSYNLGLLSIGYAFCIALLAYNKFKFSFKVSKVKNND